MVTYRDTEWTQIDEQDFLGSDFTERRDWLEWVGLAVTSALLAALILAVAVVVGA